MAWLSPLPFCAPVLWIVSLLVFREDLSRSLYDALSPFWVPSFFVLAGLNVVLFTFRYFRRRDCLYAFLFSLLVVATMAVFPIQGKLMTIPGGTHLVKTIYTVFVVNGFFYCALNWFYYLKDRDRDRGFAQPTSAPPVSAGDDGSERG